nr:reverse transcriptase domain-containing protein [Tanacetum cinerariifolium]
MTDVHTTQEFEDTHVTLTPVNPDGQQQCSSVSSQFVTSMLNPSPDAGIDYLFETTLLLDVQASTTVAPLTLTASTLPPSTIPTISQVPPTPPTTAPSNFLQDLPNFGSLFGFDHPITTRSGVSYDGPQILPPPSSLPKVVENEPEATKDTVNPTNNGITEDVQPQSDKLDDALWAFRTAHKTLIGCTIYKLVYEKACHLPVELEHKAYLALKHANFNLKTAGDHRKVQINEMNELRDQAYENSLIYKEKTKRLHGSKIKNRVFNIGDRVLLFNSRMKIFSGKLKSRWSGSFTISQVYPYGTVELSQPDGPNFNVNGYRLKHHFEEDIPKLVVPDLQTFSRDH